MTSQEMIDHVQESIDKALRHESWIDEDVLYLTGFSTGVQRRLVSNLCHLPKENPIYLEVGLYAGATFCAAMNNNVPLTAIGIEDMSQDFGKPEVFTELKSNLRKYSKGCEEMKFLQGDCFKMDRRRIPNGVDIFYYDGMHDFKPQRDALPHFFSKMKSVFVFMVDDYQWSTVREGTREGFNLLKDQLEIKNQWVLTDNQPDGVNWHNDVFIAVCEKK